MLFYASSVFDSAVFGFFTGLSIFFASRLRFRRSFSFSLGHVMLAAFMAARCGTCSLLPRDIFFRVLETWENQSLRSVVIIEIDI